MARLISYRRASNDSADLRHTLLDQQATRIQVYVHQHRHTLAVSNFYDEGLPGEGLEQALDALAAGEAEGLIVTESTRLSRDKDRLHELFGLVREMGGIIIGCSTGEVDLVTLHFNPAEQTGALTPEHVQALLAMVNR